VPNGAGDARDEPAPAIPPLRTVGLSLRVLAKGTRQPLASAAVTVDATPAGVTAADGRLEVQVVAGWHHVQVQAPGYEVVDRHVEVARDAGEALFRMMPRLTGERYETTVRAPPTGAPRVEVSAAEARQTAGTSGDPLRILGSLPGVTQVAWPAAVYVVRGTNPGNTGFFLDGMRVPAVFHLALGPSIIHPHLVGGLDFYPGAFPTQYGGAVGGVVAVRTAPPPTDRAHAAADLTLYDAAGIVTSPWNGARGTVVAAARYSFTGPLLSLVGSPTSFDYGDYQLRASHAAGAGQATLFAYGSLDRLASGHDQDVQAALQFHRLDARWRGSLAGGSLLVAVNGGVDWARSTLFARPIKVRALSVAPRISWERPLGDAGELRAGAEALLQRFATEVPMFQARRSDLARPRDAFSQAIFAALAIRAGRRLAISPGVRGDLFVEQGVHRFAVGPRLDARLALSEALALKVTGGRFVQMPSLPVNVSGFEAFGLADLGLQTSLAASAGIEAALPAAVTASVTGFGQRLRVTDVRNIDLVMPDPAAPDFLVSRRGWAAGVEVLVRRADQGRAYGWLSYTLSWSLREDDNGVLGRSDWDQRHVLNLVGGYRLRGGYSVGARVHVQTGRYAPIFDSGGQYRQLPAFYQLDLRADRRFVFDRFVLAVFVDLGNATATRQVYQLRQLGGTAPSVVEDSYRLPLPTLGLHAEF
jgi:hypothetical protein